VRNRSRASSATRAGLLATLILALLSNDGFASPWVPAPGHFYLELRETFDTTAQGFDASGSRRSLGVLAADGTVSGTRLYDAQTRLYAEVGIATRLAFVARFTLLRDVDLTRPAERGSHALGLGDLDAGFRVQLLDEEVACALEATLGIPTGRADGAQPLGSGDLRGQVLLSIGHIGQHLPFYVVIDLGAQLRSSARQSALAAGVSMPGGVGASTVSIDYASELVYALELGYVARLGERLRLFSRVTLDGRYGLTAPPVLPIDPIAPESMRFVRVGAGLGLEIAPRSKAASRSPLRMLVQVSGGAFVWGEGLPAAGDVSVALGISR
jgi:hypothetical protein